MAGNATTRMPHPYDWAVSGPPIGVWGTAEGSFSNVMATVLTLLPDGTGRVADQSAMFGERVLPLLWRFERPGELRIYTLSGSDDDRPEIADDWDVFRYRADWRQFDIGEGPVLVNDGTTGWYPRTGFWTLDAPVQLIAPAPAS